MREVGVSLGGEKQRHDFLARVCGGRDVYPVLCCFKMRRRIARSFNQKHRQTQGHMHTERRERERERERGEERK